MANKGMKGPYEGLKSGNYKIRQTPNYTPEQMQLYAQGLENVGPESYTSRLAAGDQDLFNEMEAPGRQQFSELQGNIASRFSGGGPNGVSGLGSMGGRRSSGFQNTMTKASNNFAQELQANRQNLQRQAIKDLHGMSQDLLRNEPWHNELEARKPKEESWWSKALPYATAAVGGVVGGPPGAMAGYQVGNTARNFTNPQAQGGQGGGGQGMSFKNDLPSSWGSFGDQINEYLPVFGNV